MISIHILNTQVLFIQITVHTYILSLLIFLEPEFQQYLHCSLTTLPHLLTLVTLRKSAPPNAPGQGFSHTGGRLVSPPGTYVHVGVRTRTADRGVGGCSWWWGWWRGWKSRRLLRGRGGVCGRGTTVSLDEVFGCRGPRQDVLESGDVVTVVSNDFVNEGAVIQFELLLRSQVFPHPPIQMYIDVSITQWYRHRHHFLDLR